MPESGNLLGIPTVHVRVLGVRKCSVKDVLMEDVLSTLVHALHFIEHHPLDLREC